MRYPLVLLTFCLAAWSASSQSASIDGIIVTAYGIVSGPAGTRDGVDSNGFEHWSAHSGKVVEATTRIPACIGVRFGIMYSAFGETGGKPVTVEEVYKYPRPGLRKPGVPSPKYEGYFPRGLVPGTGYGVWYEFDHSWELVPGDWILEIRDGKRLLASKTFTVVVPKKAECPGLSV